MTNLPPPQRGIVPGFIPRKRYPMVATRQTIMTQLVAAGMEKKQALAIAMTFGAIFEKQATDEFLNYRSIEAVFPVTSKQFDTIVVGTTQSGYEADQVDFLCTGTEDELVINQAIEAADGGDVLLLEGTYTLSDSILASHLQGGDDLHFRGIGAGTVLDGTGIGTVIDATAGESGPDNQWFSDFTILNGDTGIEWASSFGRIQRVNFDSQVVTAFAFNGTASLPPMITDCVFDSCPIVPFSSGGSGGILAHNVMRAVTADLFLSSWFIASNLARDGTTIDITGNDNFVTLNDILGATLTDSGTGNILFANRTIAGLTGMFQTYTHTQVAAATTWTVTHNLNCFPSVTVTLGGGEVSIADVEYVDANELLIHFATAQSGLAYLN